MCGHISKRYVNEQKTKCRKQNANYNATSKSNSFHHFNNENGIFFDTKTLATLPSIDLVRPDGKNCDHTDMALLIGNYSIKMTR